METAIFAAGCFWGVEAKFQKLDGVQETEVGYTGGHKSKPTYEEVCNDETGHAEAVKIIFDPKKISYQQLLEFFWKIHDPSTLDRQGPDVGPQYRSAIFYTSEIQKEMAKADINRLNSEKAFAGEIVTLVEKATEFYRAEEYHQCYIQKNS